MSGTLCFMYHQSRKLDLVDIPPVRLPFSPSIPARMSSLGLEVFLLISSIKARTAQPWYGSAHPLDGCLALCHYCPDTGASDTVWDSGVVGSIERSAVHTMRA